MPSPLRRLLDYRPIPDAVARPGCRVRVPLGSRSVTGVLVEIAAESEVPDSQLKTVESVIDDEALLDAQQLELMRWISNYYLHPPGEVIPLALSPRERRGEQPANTGEAGLALSLQGQGLPVGALQRAPKQALLMRLLQERPHTLPELKRHGISGAIIRTLLSKALVKKIDIGVIQPWHSSDPKVANQEQQHAIDTLTRALGSFSCHLLDGVTGSGKTEVYLQVIAATVVRGEQALVLLPEIALTPQTVERFRERFDAPLIEVHSGLSDSQRDRNWAAARTGRAAIIIGTRSAVFTPMANPGLIVVDEEHETSFSQQDGLRYSARDVAVKRGQLVGCPVLLGSATPSLETLGNVRRGRFQRHILASRAGGAQMPTREIIDIRGLALNAGISARMLEQVQTTVSEGNLALLFLNRRGFAPALRCHDCGWCAECSACDTRFTIHRQPVRLQCHHCDQRQFLPRLCPQCGSSRLIASGVGTEQTEAYLHTRFPETPIFRVDSDSIRSRSAMTSLRHEVTAANGAILIGTQMLAKGHDFPRITLAGVVDADSLLHSPDFRGEERLIQLLTQVAGRAGRGETAGRVLIQTRQPAHPVIHGLQTSSYHQQAAHLLRQRQQQGLPPYGALALLRADSQRAEAGATFLQQILQQVDNGALQGCRLVGPVAAPMARRAGWTRCHLIVSGISRESVGAAMKHLVAIATQTRVPTATRWFTDIDPIDPI